MSTKQILRRYFPVFKKTFSSTRTYRDICTHRHAKASFKIYHHRLLLLRESAVSGTFANLSLQSANTKCHRRLSNSCRCGTSHSSNVDISGDLKKYTGPEVKQTQEADPELVSLKQEVKEDDSRKLNSETVDEEDQKHTRIAADTSQLERKFNGLGIGVNKRDTEFEYDYQVAEDIEEYDYIDEKSHMEQQIQPEKVLPISLKRGQNGVFDLHELVTLLEHLGAENIVTVPVPPEANFCDDMVVVSAKSRRHLQAINDEMLWVHKRKKAKRDPTLVIEGKDKADWCAMDLGNIVLHVFYGETREYYDIESLWLLGPDHDPKCQEQTADLYILSAEDLFWLETGQVKGKVTDQVGSPVTDQDGSQSVTDKFGSQTVTGQDGSQTVTDQDGSQTVTDQDGSQTVTDQDGSQTVTGQDGRQTVTGQVGSPTLTDQDGSFTLTDQDDSPTEGSSKQLNLTSAEESVSRKTGRSDNMS
ncbi:unnamed protein product [Candidula unifasciata]|uniref:Mitochondrial assembly of ribosomal large subunit protein 1 n=1 Tax=Candidula unifasciata TaxID=100452 RepID=A0A8S3YW76_9EUPU|nr:unnamed protein product [Candidula unifasciata]